MGAALQLVRIVQIAMLASIAAYAVVGELVGRKYAPQNTLFYALSFVAITIVGATMVVRSTLVLPSEDSLRRRPDDTLTIGRWRTGHLFMYGMCEALALLGLVLRLLGFSLSHIWGFYLGGVLLLLLFSTRDPRT